jgi:hypothetical protein
LLEDMVIKGQPVESAAVDAILQDVPDKPSFGPLSPRTIVASLAHIVTSHLAVKNTGRAKGASPLKAILATTPTPSMQLVTPKLGPSHLTMWHGKPMHAAPLHHVAPVHAKPLGVPHAAVHITMAPKLLHLKSAAPPVHPVPPMRAVPLPRSHPLHPSNIPFTRRPGISPWWHQPRCNPWLDVAHRFERGFAGLPCRRGFSFARASWNASSRFRATRRTVGRRSKNAS